MNEKAIELGLTSTTFADPSGLNADNVSSAYDLSRLITYAATDPQISPIVAPIMRMAELQRLDEPAHDAIKNTNRLVVDGDVDVMGGKTGFISQGRSLPRDAAPPAADQPAGRGRRPRRHVEHRPFLGDAAPVQLAVEDRGPLQGTAPGSVPGTAAVGVRRGRAPRYLNPFCDGCRIERQRRH